MEELPNQRKEPIIVLIQKKVNKNDCSNYQEISLQRDYNETEHQIFIHLQYTYDSIRRELLYNNLKSLGTHETSQTD
jgi:hypothetical protein